VLAFIKAEIARRPADVQPMVLVTSPEIGLEFRGVRVLSNHADFESGDILRSRTYRGRVKKLFVLVQTKLVENGKADIILTSFADYAPGGWTVSPLGSFTSFVQ
jgi:hypothetical protein